ncbi:diacylglycerol kinase [Campylobacter vicugnae]|uniref:diacylglycerol kinase n=1 Tax=Campylobacter vicugnae TaxID=1660076 RepID=UPI000A35B466|nr:diacylglycerol kinase [Campylobacter sp. S0112]
MKPKYHFYSNTIYALSGLKAMVKNEHSFRIELFIIIPLFIAIWFLPLSGIEQTILGMSLLFILAMECVNSAIEACIDLVSPNFHPLAKVAKDCGSAAVFIAISSAVLCWGVIIFRMVFDA